MNEEEKEMISDELADEELAEQLGLGYPKSKESPSIFTFLNKVLDAKRERLSKVGNLNETELIALNEERKGAIYCETFGLNHVAEFFNNEVDSYLALSDSKKGFLINAAITQRKEMSAKAVSEKKRKWFQKKQEEEE